MPLPPGVIQVTSTCWERRAPDGTVQAVCHHFGSVWLVLTVTEDSYADDYDDAMSRMTGAA